VRRLSWPLIASKPGSSPPEPSGLKITTSQPLSDTTCPHPTSDSVYFRFVTLFSSKRTGQSTKSDGTGASCVRLWLTRVTVWDRVGPEGMSQVWRRSEVRTHEGHTLNTWLSSGTSEHTSSSSWNAPGRMIRSDLVWYWNKLKNEHYLSVKESSRWVICSEGSGPPLNL